MGDGRQPGVSVAAVALGVVVDVGATIFVSVALAVAAIGILLSSGVPENQVAAQLQGPVAIFLVMTYGFACTVFGGFVAGRVAGRAEVLHGGVVGVVGLILAVPLIALLWEQSPAWSNVVSLLGVVPAALFGGRLAAVGRPPRSDDPDAEWSDPYRDDVTDLR